MEVVITLWPTGQLCCCKCQVSFFLFICLISIDSKSENNITSVACLKHLVGTRAHVVMFIFTRFFVVLSRLRNHARFHFNGVVEEFVLHASVVILVAAALLTWLQIKLHFKCIRTDWLEPVLAVGWSLGLLIKHDECTINSRRSYQCSCVVLQFSAWIRMIVRAGNKFCGILVSTRRRRYHSSSVLNC